MPDRHTISFVAVQPAWLPRWLWVGLVSPNCHVKIDDIVHKVRWGVETTFDVVEGHHKIKVFHELGTLSAPASVTDLDVREAVKVQYRANFWPLRPGRLLPVVDPPV